MATRIHQIHPLPTLKRLNLPALLLIAMIIWMMRPLQVAAATKLSPTHLDWAEAMKAAALASSGRFETNLTFSQAVTPTLTTPHSAGEAGVACSTVTEDVATTSNSSQNSWVNKLLSLTRSVLPNSGYKERINVLLLGGDNRPGEKYGHTDAMMLVTIEPISQTAAVLSIPRDLWVSIPGYGEGRINQAYRLGQLKEHPGGGGALVMETVEANLGVPVDYYILINFDGFIQVVDTLGGIEICVPKTVDDAAYYGYKAQYINKDEYYSFVPLSAVSLPATESSPDQAAQADPVDPNQGYQLLYIEAGIHTLDGQTALNYARSRGAISADFARVQRQQAILMAIKTKALQLNMIPIIPELWEVMDGLVETNLELTDIVQLARLAQTIPQTSIWIGAIGQNETIDYKTGSGAQVLLPEREAIKSLIEGIFGPATPTAPPTQAEIDATAQNNQVEQSQATAWK